MTRPSPARSSSRGAAPRRVDEEQLVERVLAGDPAASRTVLRYVGPAVLRTVRGVLGGMDPDVDDLVQDAFVALLRALPAFRGDSRLRTFATGIAAKIAMSTLRRRYQRGDRPTPDMSMVSGPVDLDAVVLQEQRLAMVRETVARLTRPQGEALLLRWVLGHSLGEVAEITGAPINTVRSRLRLGRNALMEILREDPRWAELQEERR